jgi:orotate phosphoribosyltransferase
MNEEEILEILQDAGAIKRGHFQLTSGLHADTYYQCAAALENPHITEKMGDEIATMYEDQAIDLVVSPAMGGIILGFATALALGCRFIWAERTDGVMTFRRGFCVHPGERVLVVEDVVTTGGSVAEVIELVRAAGGIIAGAACLMNRGALEEVGGAKLKSLVTVATAAYEPVDCPLCAAGQVTESPGSRRI